MTEQVSEGFGQSTEEKPKKPKTLAEMMRKVVYLYKDEPIPEGGYPISEQMGDRRAVNIPFQMKSLVQPEHVYGDNEIPKLLIGLVSVEATPAPLRNTLRSPISHHSRTLLTVSSAVVRLCHFP